MMEVVRCNIDHIRFFLTQPIRYADIHEWRAAGHEVPDALPHCLQYAGGINRALKYDGRCIAIWGVTPSERAWVGNVWLIASKEAASMGARIHRQFKGELDLLAKDYPLGLEAHSHAPNVLHHRWLRMCGFKPEGTWEAFTGETFHQFYKEPNV